MPLISPTLPSDGDDITEESNNQPLEEIIALLNGNLDTDNISSLNGSKIVDGSLSIDSLEDGMGASITEGWISTGVTVSRVSDSSLKLVGDWRTKIGKGVKIRLTNNSLTKYFYIVSSGVFSTGETTYDVAGGSDYIVLAGTVSDLSYSNSLTPSGFPNYFNYTPVFTTASGSPAIGNGNLFGRFSMYGGNVSALLGFVAGSTTNFGSGGFRLSLPIEAGSKTSLGFDFYSTSSAIITDAGTNDIPANAIFFDSTKIYFIVSNGSAASSSVPMAWTTNDRLFTQINYQSK